MGRLRMARRSRRNDQRSSRRNLWLGAAVVAILVLSIVGYYVIDVRAGTATRVSSTTSSTTSTSSLGPYAVLQTSQGAIVIQLFPTIAPVTVANFEQLANSGFYSDLVWHRIVQGFVIQTGDPTTRDGAGNESAWGGGGSGTTIAFENTSLLAAEEGTVAMARGSALDSASSQFFINLANNTSLTGQYTIFGRVVMGMNVALYLGNLPVNPDCQSSGQADCQPLQPDQAMLFSVSIQDTP